MKKDQDSGGDELPVVALEPRPMLTAVDALVVGSIYFSGSFVFIAIGIPVQFLLLTTVLVWSFIWWRNRQ